jgi:hypothetical protein
MEILGGTPTTHDRSWKMLSFMTSQAIALSQPKKAASEPRMHARAEHRRRKGFFSSVFDALVVTRMRRAEIEIEHHRRFYEGHTK